MAELISGPTMVLNWATSTGTIALKADYQTCDWSPSVAYAEVTAGQDTQVGRIPTIKDATAAVTLVGQTGGTALKNALQAGQAGTLTIQPEGTAVGKRVITLPAYCDGAKDTWPYATVEVISVGFSGSSVLAAYTDSQN